jgi:hypothetical protein
VVKASAAEISSRIASIQREAVRRLHEEPGVRTVAFASDLPGARHPVDRIEIEVDPSEVKPSGGHAVRYAMVDAHFFEALGQRVVLGRNFDSRDLTSSARPVIVNRSFVDRVLKGRPALGVRVRYVPGSADAPEPWREIIGVVEDLGMNVLDPAQAAGVYHLVAPGQVHPVHMLVRLTSAPETFVPRLRAVFNAIDPAMVLNEPSRLDAVFSEELWEARFMAFGFAAVAIASVVLSAAGLYALIAFSVAQRTREIAIRTALGASPVTVVRVVVRRAMVQLTVGVAAGATIGAMLVPSLLSSATLAENWRIVLVAVSVSMFVIGLLACGVPIRRALRIQPIAALKDL